MDRRKIINLILVLNKLSVKIGPPEVDFNQFALGHDGVIVDR